VSSRFSELIVDARDAWALADWWASVLEVPVGEKDEGDGMRWAHIKPPDTVREIVFLDVPEAKTIKNRLHIDLRPLGCDQATELTRLQSLGATEVDRAGSCSPIPRATSSACYVAASTTRMLRDAASRRSASGRVGVNRSCSAS
jgi:hypothetical protein